MHTVKFHFSILALAATLLAATGQDARACGPDTYVGSICFMATSYCPRGFYPAQGQALQISDHPKLYSLYGNTFGSGTRSIFFLPDLRGRTVVGAGRAGTLVDLGQKRGTTQVVLTPNMLAQHSHAVDTTDEFGEKSAEMAVFVSILASSQLGTLTSPVGNYPAKPSNDKYKPYYHGLSPVEMAASTPQKLTVNTTAAGTTTPSEVDIQGPRLALTACVGGSDQPYPTRQ